jgi:hypothetical protein
MNTSTKSGRSDSAARKGERGAERSSDERAVSEELARLPISEEKGEGWTGGKGTVGAGKTTERGGDRSCEA